MEAEPMISSRSVLPTIDSGRVLITGSSGFIGGELQKRFRALGWDTLGIGRRPSSAPGYRVHDLGEPLGTSFPSRCDAVIHAAARSSPWGRGSEFHRDNILATANVIDYCRRNGLPKLVFISSSSVYYRPAHQFGITEETPLPRKAVNRYAATKRVAESLVREYPGPWAILRPRAVFGPGDTVLLPRVVRAARAGRLPLLVSQGPPVVGDLIYIDNLVDCVVRAASDAGIQGVFNLTNNEPVPIVAFLLDVLERLKIPEPRRRVTLRTAMAAAFVLEGVHRVFLPWREPPITRFGVHVFAYSKTFDVSKMIARMGTPRISLRDGLERAVEWLRDGDSE